MNSFKSYLFVEENFESFQQYLQKSGMTFPELLQRLQAQQPSGKGGNADFYKIPGTDFGVRVVRRFSNPDKNPQLQAAHDPHEGENVGQPVAHYGNNVQVLRLQQGKPAGFPYGIKQNDPDEEQKALGVFRQQVLHAAQMPDQEYERLFTQILKLNQRGYVVDPSKSGNLLIDPNTGRFNLVDLNKKEAENKYTNNAGEILLMLMGNYHFSKYFHSDNEMKTAAREIIKKIEAASQKTGLPLNRSNSSVDYSYKLANGEVEPPPEAPPSAPPKTNGWGNLVIEPW